MPCIRDESTVKSLARAFISNGRNQEQAMIEVGYSKAYANSYCGKMWDNPCLKAAIAKIDGKQAEIGQRTVKGLDEMYEECYAQAKSHKQPSAMVSAVTGIARLYGMDKDNQAVPDKPVSITAAEAERYRAMADAATAEQVSKPHLSKELA